jgi:hypothetical protein
MRASERPRSDPNGRRRHTAPARGESACSETLPDGVRIAGYAVGGFLSPLVGDGMPIYVSGSLKPRVGDFVQIAHIPGYRFGVLEFYRITGLAAGVVALWSTAGLSVPYIVRRRDLANISVILDGRTFERISVPESCRHRTPPDYLANLVARQR